MTAPPAIYVDADACPVKQEVIKVAERHGLVVTFVSNGGLRPSRDPMIRNVVVSKGADAADDWIVEHVRANDIVVTSEIPLARSRSGRMSSDRPAGRSRRTRSAWLSPCVT